MSHFTPQSIHVNSKDESKLLPLSITWEGELAPRPKKTPNFQVYKGIDTLHIGLYVYWNSVELFNLLEAEKQNCIADDHKNHSMKVKGFSNVIVYPYGKKGGYAWQISTGDIHIFFSTHNSNSNTPNVFVEIGSISCWDRAFLMYSEP